MFYVYVIKNLLTHKRYTGYTKNIHQRIKKHNTNHKGYTGQRGEWVLVYSEQYRNKNDALLREKFLKSGKGREFLNSLRQ